MTGPARAGLYVVSMYETRTGWGQRICRNQRMLLSGELVVIAGLPASRPMKFLYREGGEIVLELLPDLFA